MSGTAFNGSPWLTAAEIAGLVLLSFGGAAVGGRLMRAGLERESEAATIEEAIAKQSTTATTRRRRYAANAEVSATSNESTTEALAVPEVVADNGNDPSA